jgi:hypothetical protein
VFIGLPIYFRCYREVQEKRFLEEKSEDLSSEVFPAGLLVVHDSSGGGHDDVAEIEQFYNKPTKITNRPILTTVKYYIGL